MSKPDPEKPAWQYSTKELIQLLSERCSTLVLGAHVPDDRNICGTYLITTGNRAAGSGLAQTLADYTAARVESNSIIVNDDVDENNIFGDQVDLSEEDDSDDGKRQPSP